MDTRRSTTCRGGLTTTLENIKQNPGKIIRFMRASVKGLHFYLDFSFIRKANQELKASGWKP